jgi:uncharacterized membrane protein YgdD (TMEM256/DUF423 family)
MSQTAALFILLAGLNGLMAVLAGAWASHGFVIPLADGGGALAETGSRYQMWHALALLGVGIAYDRVRTALVLWRLPGIAFITGIAGFSGGLYASAGGAPVSGVAPAGGAALMAGWLLLALAGGLELFSRR